MSRLPHAPAGLVTAEKLGILLRDRGCVVVDSLFSDSLATVRVELERVLADGRLGDNNFDGYVTRRVVFDPLARTRVLDELLLHDLIAATVDAVIGAAQLGMTVVADVRPGEVAQRLHRDTAVCPLPRDWPGHGQHDLGDRRLHRRHRRNAAGSEQPSGDGTSHRLWSSRPGSRRDGRRVGLVYDGRLVHGAGRNDTSSGRLGLIIEHVVRWLRPGENHSPTVPKEVAVTLPMRLQELLGYNQHGSYLGFVAGCPPRDWLIENSGSGSERSAPPDGP